MTLRSGILLLVLTLLAGSAAAEFGTPGGQVPANIDQMMAMLSRDPHDLELLISYGTSKGGSAGHLALAMRDDASGDDIVHSANFYADRAPEHAKGFYTDELMVRIPKKEYLYKTTSTLADTASFGLDFGEIYKRSVIGVRVYGVPRNQRSALAAYFARMNDDYRNRAAKTEYHGDEVKYDYIRLNCAKTIGSAFKYGAGYNDLEVRSAKVFPNRKLAAAANANIPTEMAVKLMKEWNARGYRIDVVLYRKYKGSTYVDPHEEEKIAFKDLPDRFPSVMSLDFVRDQGEYEDYDNLYAMYLLYNLGRASIRIDEKTGLLEIEKTRTPLPFDEAATRARRGAETDSRKFQERVVFRASGKRIGEPLEGN